LRGKKILRRRCERWWESNAKQEFARDVFTG